MFPFNLLGFNKSRAEYPSFPEDDTGKMNRASMSNLLHNVWADAGEIAKSNPSEGGRSSQEEILGKIGDISTAANGSCEETEVQRDGGDTLREEILGETRGISASANRRCEETEVQKDNGDIPMATVSPCSGLEDIWLL
jgi:hypothetical protein